MWLLVFAAGLAFRVVGTRRCDGELIYGSSHCPPPSLHEGSLSALRLSGFNASWLSWTLFFWFSFHNSTSTCDVSLSTLSTMCPGYLGIWCYSVASHFEFHHLCVHFLSLKMLSNTCMSLMRPCLWHFLRDWFFFLVCTRNFAWVPCLLMVYFYCEDEWNMQW